MRNEEAPSRLEAALVAEFRRHHAAREWRRRAWAAVAASVLAFLGLTTLRMGSAPAPAAAATHFLAMPGVDPREPLDHGRVVRVELPRSSLRTFGLPMNEERGFEAVKADVLLGEDGMARAIRFLH